MFAHLLGIIFAIIAFVSAGIVSYTYLDHSAVPHVSVPWEEESRAISATTSVPKAPQKTTTTGIVQKKSLTSKIDAPTKTDASFAVTAAATETTVVLPGPLRAATEESGVGATVAETLTGEGVLLYTNSARAQNGALPALTRNETLDRSAQIKLDDMFGRQYFEHISPTGIGPADLAKTVGYAYVVVGENLALGNFGSDMKLVDAWMASPGHRANILNTHYQEIGIAVGKGMYEGRETWLAVQSFGMPLSACPAIDAAAKAEIENNNKEIAVLRAALDAKKAQLEATAPYDPRYNALVGEYNVLVSPYNTLVESTRVLIASYNAGVQAFNECIAAAGSHE